MTDGGDLLEDDESERVQETEEQRREKKTLYWANMAQARALNLSHRYSDATDALSKVIIISHHPLLTGPLTLRPKITKSINDLHFISYSVYIQYHIAIKIWTTNKYLIITILIK